MLIFLEHRGGDFSFPYNNPQSKVQQAKEKTRDLFFNNKWSKAIYPLSWLVEKFWPIKNGDKIYWTDEDLKMLKAKEGLVITREIGYNKDMEDSQNTGKITKGIIYFTDNQLNLKIAKKVQEQLRKNKSRKEYTHSFCIVKTYVQHG